MLDVITNSYETIASFKMLSNQQLMDSAFPLPAILGLMALIEKKEIAITVTPLAVSSKENLAETPGPSSLYTGKMAEVTACEFKAKISDINC